MRIVTNLANSAMLGEGRLAPIESATGKREERRNDP